MQNIVLGEGAHRYAARDHAEIVALKQAAALGHSVRGATAYVTLEPCSHHGRTGPCADALVAAGIARCVVATVDPNPLVSGNGLKRLRDAGVTVDLLAASSAEAQTARRLNDAFAFSVRRGRPFVTLKAALSLDGKLAPPPSARNIAEPVWLTGAAARADVHRLRHASDVLLTGIGTVLADDPHLTDRSGLPRRRPLVRAVLDSSLRLLPEAALVREAADDLILFFDPAAASPERRALLERHPLQLVPIEGLNQTRALTQVLEYLQQQQFRSVMTEGGATLNAALLQADLVDRVILYYAPGELGPEALPFAGEATSPYTQKPPHLQPGHLQNRLTSQTQSSFPHGATEDVRISGYLHDPWAGI